MDSKTINPVDIIQELIAIHTTRIEAASKLNSGLQPGDLDKITKQSQSFTGQLVGELANYGDAVQSTAERNNKYQNSWRLIIGKSDQLRADEAGKIFYSLEQVLKSIYMELLEGESQLPPSVLKLFNAQSNQVSG